jgi:hypothetical protein
LPLRLALAGQDVPEIGEVTGLIQPGIQLSKERYNAGSASDQHDWASLDFADVMLESLQYFLGGHCGLLRLYTAASGNVENTVAHPCQYQFKFAGAHTSIANNRDMMRGHVAQARVKLYEWRREDYTLYGENGRGGMVRAEPLK